MYISIFSLLSSLFWKIASKQEQQSSVPIAEETVQEREGEEWNEIKKRKKEKKKWWTKREFKIEQKKSRW